MTRQGKKGFCLTSAMAPPHRLLAQRESSSRFRIFDATDDSTLQLTTAGLSASHPAFVGKFETSATRNGPLSGRLAATRHRHRHGMGARWLQTTGTALHSRIDSTDSRSVGGWSVAVAVAVAQGLSLSCPAACRNRASRKLGRRRSCCGPSLNQEITVLHDG